MFILKLLGAIFIQMVLLAVILFGPAGTWDWWQAWVVIGIMAAISLWSVFGLPRDLLEERLKPPVQQGQPLADRIVVLSVLATYYAAIIFIPLDVFRLHLLPPPGPVIAFVGLVLLVGGCGIVYCALKENAFAAPVVRHQEERRQRVIDTGVYHVVRHPMYAGALLLLVGMPVWLGSFAGALVAGVPIALLVVRIGIEERFLRRELPGYDDYARRVRYRLIPFLW